MEVRLVGHAQLRSFGKHHLSLPEKDDDADALALALYGWDYLHLPGDFYKSEREKLLKFVNLCCGLRPQPRAVANHQPRWARFSLAVSRSGTCARGALLRKRTLALGLAGRRKTKQKVRSALRGVNRLRNSRLGWPARCQTKAACRVSSWRSSKNYINCLPFHSLHPLPKSFCALWIRSAN